MKMSQLWENYRINKSNNVLYCTIEFFVIEDDATFSESLANLSFSISLASFINTEVHLAHVCTVINLNLFHFSSVILLTIVANVSFDSTSVYIYLRICYAVVF